jgi:hypothetical protein
MCKRFIEDLANKIIEKNNLENLTIAELKEINKNSQIIIDKRKQILLDELNEVHKLENYIISLKDFTIYIKSLDLRKIYFFFLILK